MKYFIHIKDGVSREMPTYAALIRKSEWLNRIHIAHTTEIKNDSNEAIKVQEE